MKILVPTVCGAFATLLLSNAAMPQGQARMPVQVPIRIEGVWTKAENGERHIDLCNAVANDQDALGLSDDLIIFRGNRMYSIESSCTLNALIRDPFSNLDFPNTATYKYACGSKKAGHITLCR